MLILHGKLKQTENKSNSKICLAFTFFIFHFSLSPSDEMIAFKQVFFHSQFKLASENEISLSLAFCSRSKFFCYLCGDSVSSLTHTHTHKVLEFSCVFFSIAHRPSYFSDCDFIFSPAFVFSWRKFQNLVIIIIQLIYTRGFFARSRNTHLAFGGCKKATNRKQTTIMKGNSHLGAIEKV